MIVRWHVDQVSKQEPGNAQLVSLRIVLHKVVEQLMYNHVTPEPAQVSSFAFEIASYSV